MASDTHGHGSPEDQPSASFHPPVPRNADEERDEAEALALAATFDARLKIAEKRIDKLLVRLGIDNE